MFTLLTDVYLQQASKGAVVQKLYDKHRQCRECAIKSAMDFAMNAQNMSFLPQALQFKLVPVYWTTGQCIRQELGTED